MWESLKQLSCCHDNLQIKDSTNQTIASHPHTPLALIVPKLLLIYCKLAISENLGLRLHSTVLTFAEVTCAGDETPGLSSLMRKIYHIESISKLNKPL